jgi:hypothetical protein
MVLSRISDRVGCTPMAILGAIVYSAGLGFSVWFRVRAAAAVSILVFSFKNVSLADSRPGFSTLPGPCLAHFISLFLYATARQAGAHATVAEQ